MDGVSVLTYGASFVEYVQTEHVTRPVLTLEASSGRWATRFSAVVQEAVKPRLAGWARRGEYARVEWVEQVLWLPALRVLTERLVDGV